MSEIIDAVKAFVSPAEKLIEAVRAAIGKAYEPRSIRRIADAEAYRIETVGRALRESSDIPIVYSNGDITMDTSDFDAFKKRTESRLAYQELLKQKNIETVAGFAYDQLVNEPNVPDEPVDADWMNRFFDSVAEVSNEQMQRIWAKLLAGEIKQPNTFSMRTLETLKNLTQHEADLFGSICPFIMKCPGNKEKSIEDYFILADYAREKSAPEYYVLQMLEDAGLLSTNSYVFMGFELASEESQLIEGCSKAIKTINLSSEIVNLSHQAYFLTAAGKELYTLVTKDNPPDNYYEEIIEYLKKGDLNGSISHLIEFEIVELE